MQRDTHTHTHTYSQGQLTTVHLFWTDVLSSSTAQVSVLSFTRRRPHLVFSSSSHSTRVPDREPFLSAWWAAIISACLSVLCRAPSPRTRGKRPLPCGSFATPSVQRLWWPWWLPCLCSWLALIAPLVYTVVQPLSKVSELGVFLIVNNKGKLATPQRSCYFYFISFVSLLWMAIPFGV